MQTVTFGTKNSYDDFGLILTDKDIGFPEPKLEEVDVIGADGVIELSEVLNDDIKYKTRKLQFTFTVLKGNKYWASTVADVGILKLCLTFLNDVIVSNTSFISSASFGKLKEFLYTG